MAALAEVGEPQPALPVEIAPVGPSPLVVTEPISTRAKPRWLWGVVPIIALLIAGGVWFFASQTTNLPIAAPGETLVIIAPFSHDIKTPIATPQRRFSGDDSASLSNASSRLQVALEREVRAARLERVRVEIAPDSITDAVRAEQIRQRTNATLVVWGEAKNQNIAVGFALAPLASRLDDMPLDTLVVAPTDARMTIAGDSTEEIHTIALIVLSQLQLARGDFGMARAALALASSNSPSDPSVSATLNLFAGYTAQISKPSELGAAMQFYSQTIALAPETPSAFLNRGVVYIRLNDAAGWQSDLTRALALAPEQVKANLAYCWAYALDKQPNLGLPYCDAAVTRDATAPSREARAVVYAQAGRLPDAANDLRIFVDWLARQPEGLRTRYGTSRSEWLTALLAEQNPIDDAALERLRRE